jgi:hypothetical protein
MRLYQKCLWEYRSLGWLPTFVDPLEELAAFSARAQQLSLSYTETLSNLIPRNSPTHWYLMTHAVFPWKDYVIKDQFIQAMISILTPTKLQMQSVCGELIIPEECKKIAEAFDAEPILWAKFNEVAMLVPIFSSMRLGPEPIYVDDLDFALYEKKIDANRVIQTIAQTEVIDLSSDDPF